MRKKITELIITALNEANQDSNVEMQFSEPIDETVLYGPNGFFDSLGLVNLIVATEQKIEEELGIIITLADERAMSQKNSPFRTIGTLADYILLILEENANE